VIVAVHVATGAAAGVTVFRLREAGPAREGPHRCRDEVAGLRRLFPARISRRTPPPRRARPTGPGRAGESFRSCCWAEARWGPTAPTDGSRSDSGGGAVGPDRGFDSYRLAPRDAQRVSDVRDPAASAREPGQRADVLASPVGHGGFVTRCPSPAFRSRASTALEKAFARAFYRELKSVARGTVPRASRKAPIRSHLGGIRAGTGRWPCSWRRVGVLKGRRTEREERTCREDQVNPDQDDQGQGQANQGRDQEGQGQAQADRDQDRGLRARDGPAQAVRYGAAG